MLEKEEEMLHAIISRCLSSVGIEGRRREVSINREQLCGYLYSNRSQAATEARDTMWSVLKMVVGNYNQNGSPAIFIPLMRQIAVGRSENVSGVYHIDWYNWDAMSRLAEETHGMTVVTQERHISPRTRGPRSSPSSLS